MIELIEREKKISTFIFLSPFSKKLYTSKIVNIEAFLIENNFLKKKKRRIRQM